MADLERPSISEVWELAGGQVLGTRSGWAKAVCAFHVDRSPSASVNEEAGKFYCFSCGEHGDVFDVIKMWKNLETFAEVKEVVAELVTEFGVECNATESVGGRNGGLRKSAHSASGGLSRKSRTTGGGTFRPNWRRW